MTITKDAPIVIVNSYASDAHKFTSKDLVLVCVYFANVLGLYFAFDCICQLTELLVCVLYS